MEVIWRNKLYMVVDDIGLTRRGLEEATWMLIGGSWGRYILLT